MNNVCLSLVIDDLKQSRWDVLFDNQEGNRFWKDLQAMPVEWSIQDDVVVTELPRNIVCN